MSKNREDVTQVPDAANKPPEVTAKTDLPSPSSKFSLSQGEEKVNNDYIVKEASSQEENASFFDYNSEKRVPKINPDEVIEGMWEDAPNTSKYTKNTDVEKSRAKSDFGKVYLNLQNLQNSKNYDILNNKISKGEISISINPEMQNRHILGTREYIEGRSYFTISMEELQSIINSKYATGRVTISKSGQIKETMFIDKIVGIDKDLDGREYETNGIKIHYSKSRTHIVPYREVNLNELETNN